MSDIQTVTVHIMDKEYLVSCPSDARSSLEHAARTLDSKMREIRATGKVIGMERIAVMAALNLIHESADEKKQTFSQEQLSLLAEHLDKALVKSPHDKDLPDQGSL